MLIYMGMWGGPINYVDPNGMICFDFNKFTNQVDQNKFDLSATFGTLVAAESVGTMPKTPNELRGLGVPKSELNPYTGQLSRWSSRLGTRLLRELGRTAKGVAVGTIATGALIFEGFYDWSVIVMTTWDSSSSGECDCNGK